MFTVTEYAALSLSSTNQQRAMPNSTFCIILTLPPPKPTLGENSYCLWRDLSCVDVSVTDAMDQWLVCRV